MSAEWVTAIGTCVGAGGLIFVALQTLFANRQLRLAADQIKLTTDMFRADHERSRRERAVEALGTFFRTLDRAHPSARTLVESLGQAECEKLKLKKGFRIPKEKHDLVMNVLHGYVDSNPPRIEGDSVVLSDNHAAHIYFLCISHLNSLEIALQSWLVNIADEDMLEQELQYLVKPDQGHYVLPTFRDVVGGRASYPAIHEFVEHIKDKKNGGPGRRPRVA